MVLFAVAFTAAAHAECVYSPDLAAYQTPPPEGAELTGEEAAVGTTRSDSRGRVVVPVSVNGAGPFRFIVDTGANRSAVSEGLAQRLGLQAIGSGEVHTVHGVSVAPLMDVDSLRYRDVSFESQAMPMLEGPVLAGEQGLLGVDGMRGRRLRMDFERNCIEIAPARTAQRLRGWTRIRGVMRFGHLVVIRGTVNRVRVNLLLDTGSDSSLANTALRDALNARVTRRQSVTDFAVAHTASEPIVLDRAMFLPRLTLAGVDVRNVRAYVGDFHIFRLWGLTDEPTLLVGMDVLSQAGGLAIDYERGNVYVRLREGPRFMNEGRSGLLR